MSPTRAALLFALTVSVPAFGAGHAFNENFSVLTPPQTSSAEAQAYAERVLQQAETYRKQLALEWLGDELSPGAGRTMINVEFSDEDSALTWRIDNPLRKYHMLYLAMSPDRAVGSGLKHEIIHVIMATRFPHPNRLPAWLEEGIASRYDDRERVTHRHEMVLEYARTGSWPSLERILSSRNIASGDYSAYAIAESLIDFLLTRGDKATLLNFAADVATGNVQGALHVHYDMGSIDELESTWHKWVLKR